MHKKGKGGLPRCMHECAVEHEITVRKYSNCEQLYSTGKRGKVANDVPRAPQLMGIVNVCRKRRGDWQTWALLN